MNAAAALDEKAQQILSAVRILLAKKGYAATTISLVAAKAGVSRGLLHYYFKNKDDMLATVLETNMQASISLLREILVQSNSAPKMASGLVHALKQVLKDDPTFFHLYFEGWAVARQSELVDRKLKSLYGQFREALETCLDDAWQRGILSFSIPVKGLAALLTGILDGMGLQLVTETDLAEDETIWQALETGILRLLSE